MFDIVERDITFSAFIILTITYKFSTDIIIFFDIQKV